MTRFLVFRPRRGSVLGLLAVALAACGGGSEGTGAAAEAGSARGAEVARAAPGEPSPGGQAEGEGEEDSFLFEKRERAQAEWKTDNIRRRDPAFDGWESEVLNDRAKLALERFLAALIQPADDEPAWESLLSASFRGATPLRPAGLETVFDDGALVVLRPVSIDPELREPSAFPAQLADLLEPFEGARELEAASKILKIDVDGDRFETIVKVELDGLVDGAPVQQSSDWRVGWVAGDEDALLESFHLLAYEEARAPRPLFGELTRHVFGGADFWEREFRLGVPDYYFRVDKMTGNAFIGGQGLAVGDVNGDGLDDVYVCQQGGLPNRLFLHQPDGTAIDAAPEANVDFLDNTRSALIADLDNDGHQDLALAIRSNILLCFGEGDGKFGDLKALAGRGTEDIFSLSTADPDQDGDLDLYGCRYTKDGIIGGVPVPYHDADNGARNLYWVNEGGREFSDGMRGNGLNKNNTKFSLAAIWEDLDLDGDQDLYVTNDFGRNNLYRNDGKRFRDVAIDAGADDMAAGMGASSADIDLDGYPDLLITNMFSSAGLRIASMSGHFMGGENEEVHGHYVRHARGNTLLCNRGDGTFEDVTEQAGVALGRWGWGAHFIELDNDGLEDIYVPNGFITNTDPRELGSFFWRRVTAQSPPEAGEATDEYRNAWASIQHMVMADGASWSGSEKNCVYLNIGGRSFANVSSVSRGDYPDDARAVATVDWDDDGRLDLIVKNRTAPRLRLLRNQGAEGGHFLSVELVGTECNRDAVGASVVVELEGRTLRKTVFVGDGYLSQSSKRLHFGLADAERVDELTVHWPGGEAESFRDLPADARLRIVQGSGRVEPREAHPHEDFARLEPAAETRSEGRVDRTVLVDKLPISPAPLPSFEDPKRRVKDFEGAPLLIQLWRSTSAACLREFGELRDRREAIRESGARLATLTLDEGPELVRARQVLARFGLDQGAGYADQTVMQTLEVFFVEVLGRSEDVALPATLLVDPAGQLVAIYQGAVDVDVLLGDVETVKRMDPTRTTNVALTGGRWYLRGNRELDLLSNVFEELGRERLAQYYASLAERQ